MKISEAKKKFESYLRTQHKAKSTIEAYVNRVSDFGIWLIKNPDKSKLDHSKRVEAYLTYRVLNHDISPSTQNVDLNALVSFHHMLGIDLKNINALRAHRRDRIPPILNRKQINTLLDNFPAEHKLIPLLLYGLGMRINEVLRLRIKDVDFENEKIVIHESKGDKDRSLQIPEVLLEDLKAQYSQALGQWKIDKTHRFNGVNCGGVEKKYPAYPTSKDWYWLFPAKEYSTDSGTGKSMMRHHVYDFQVQKMFIAVRTKYDMPVYTSAHKLRHACFTHMAEAMLKQGFPEKMIRAQLSEMAGHINEETINFYIHLAAPKHTIIQSPLENLENNHE